MKKLKLYGGQGYENSNKNGKFKVQVVGKVRLFTKLSKAKIYYDSLNETKAIWDLTIIPELIEYHHTV